MNLEYKILWVDDKIDSFINTLGYESDIKNYLDKLFFTPILDTYETVEEAKKMLTKNKYDLILSDYNIDTEKGDDFIRYVRRQNVNTEILFYSALTTVPGLDIDRISFFSIPTTDGYPQLLEKIKNLIKLTIEKLQDLTVIRGLVMAGTSHLDKLMEEIILHYFITQKNNERDKIFEEILSELEKNHKNKLKTDDCKKNCTIKLRQKKMQDIIVSIDFESSRKARTINKIIENIEKFTYETKKNFYEDYFSEIIEYRNNLAHSRSEQRGNSEVLIPKKQNEEIIFDEAKFREIRENILKYAKVLKDLKMSLG